MVLIFYVSAVLATKLFGESHAALFGSITGIDVHAVSGHDSEGWSTALSARSWRFTPGHGCSSPVHPDHDVRVLNLVVAIIRQFDADAERFREG